MSKIKSRGFARVVAGTLALAVGAMALFGAAGGVLASPAFVDDDNPDASLMAPRRGGRGFGGGFAGGEDAGDRASSLAEELGITVEELQAAQGAAREDALAQALEEGTITQEQVDQMEARKALAEYIDQEALLEEALGMTPDEVREAIEAGDLDPEDVREKLAEAQEAALAQAVADGVITQEQADEMASRDPQASRMGGKPGGRGCEDGELPEGFDGSEMPRGRGRFAPYAEGDSETSGMRFSRPGRNLLQDGSDL